MRDHPAGAEGWRVYETQLAPLLNCGHEPLYVVLWTDKYGVQNSRHNSFCSVLVTFANFSKKVRRPFDSHHVTSFVGAYDPKVTIFALHNSAAPHELQERDIRQTFD